MPVIQLPRDTLTFLLASVLLALLNLGRLTAQAQIAFAPPVDYVVGRPTGVTSALRAIVAGDFNGDGHVDLAVVDVFSDTVAVLLNNGNGTFAPAVHYATGNDPSALTVGDFNGDGTLDLAVANGGPGVEIGGPGMASGDMNGDGTLDLAIGSDASSSVSILLNQGDGTFVLGATYATNGGELSLLFNQGDGTFTPGVAPVPGSAPTAIHLQDVDSDGDLDLAVAMSGRRTVTIFLNHGNGTFAPGSDVVRLGLPVGFTFTAGDFDGDEDVDLAVAYMDGSASTSGVFLLRNRGDGTFVQELPYLVALYPVAITGTDLDGDGVLDLVTAHGFDRIIGVLRNHGDGTFAAAVDIRSSSMSGLHARAVAAADLDGDGDADLAVVHNSDGLSTVAVLLNRTPQVPKVPDIVVTPTSFDFGSVHAASASSQTFTVTNRGNGALVIGTITLTGVDLAEFSVHKDTCSRQTIAPLHSCTLDAAFMPTSTGAKSATLTIPSNDPDTPTLEVPLLGYGLPAQTPPLAHITNQDGTVSVIDTATNTVLATVPPGGIDAFGVAIHPAGTFAYVTYRLSAIVAVIDTATHTVSATIPVGTDPKGLAVTPTGSHIYVANEVSETVSVIDTATHTVTDTIAVGRAPRGVAVHPAETFVYVTNAGSDTVSILDTAADMVVATVPVGDLPFGVAVHPAGTQVYVANEGSGTVSVIDATTHTVTHTIPVGRKPRGVAMHPTGTRVYVTNFDDHTVSVIDTTLHTVVATIPLESGNPFGVALTRVGTQAYVAKSGAHTVAVIDTTSNTVIDTIPVGFGPQAFGQFIGPVANHPTPDIKANGVDGPLVVDTATPVRITVALHPGQFAGVYADWWVVALTPTGSWFSFVYPTGWHPGLHPAIQTGLCALAPTVVFHAPLAARGTYLVFFGIDGTPDDGINVPLLFDVVAVQVQ